MSNQPVGKTKDQGWEIGVRRTFPVNAERAWEILVTPPGLDAWFGNDPDLKLERNASFATRDGTTGHIVSVQEGALLRLRWQPHGWHESSTLQLRIIPAGEKATISIHHERLSSAEQREEMQRRWSQVLDTINDIISK